MVLSYVVHLKTKIMQYQSMISTQGMDGYFGIGQESHRSSQICCYDFKETLLNIFLPTLIETNLQIEIKTESLATYDIFHVILYLNR